MYIYQSVSETCCLCLFCQNKVKKINKPKPIYTRLIGPGTATGNSSKPKKGFLTINPIFKDKCSVKKSSIRERVNLSTDADSITDTKMDKNWQRGPYFFFRRSKNPFLPIFVCFGIGANIRIGQEIQCLPYAGFSPPLPYCLLRVFFFIY